MLFVRIILFGLLVLIIAFAKTILVNIALCAVVSRKAKYTGYTGKRLVLKTSLSSVLSELAAFLILTAIAAAQLVGSVHGGSGLYRVLISVLMVIYTLLAYPDYGTFSTVLLMIAGVVIAIVLNVVFNYFFIFKSKEIPRAKRLLLSLCFAVLDAPYHFLISFGALPLFSSVI